MNKNIASVIAMLAALGVCGAGWWLLPSLESARRRVDTDASVQVERARRLLHQFNASLAYKSTLTDQLSEYGIETDPEFVSEDLEDEYQSLHERTWEAYQPVDWDRETPARANYGNLSRQIGDGLRGQAALVGDNDRLLDRALRAVDQALAVTAGSESGRTHFEANRLKATILYHKGLATWVEAQLLRREASRFRSELTDLVGSAVAAAGTTSLVADSDVENQIADLEAEADDFEALIDEDRDRLADCEDRISELESRLAAAKTKRDRARRAIDRLKAAGVDPTDPEGVGRFERELGSLGREFRGADRLVQEIAHGTYASAQLEPGGDYLTGRYLDEGGASEPAVEHGLDHYHDVQRVSALTVEQREQTLEDIREAVARLEGMKEIYEETQSRSVEEVANVATSAGEVYSELNRIDSEAFTIEEEALESLDSAAQAARGAASLAQRWVSDAREHTQDMSPEARNRSAFEHRSKVGWIGAHIAAQEADARLAKAWIHYARYRAYSQNATILSRIAESVQLTEADPDAERSKAQHAHDVGVAEVTQAMGVLEKTHRDSGRHWTFTAQAAGTTYLMALFGHADYVADTIEAYRLAVRGREDRSHAAKFVARLNDLERR